MPKPSKDDIAMLKRHELLMRAIERPYTAAIKLSKNQYIKAAADYYKIHGELPHNLYTVHALQLKYYGKLYNSKAIKVFAKDFLKTIEPQLRSDHKAAKLQIIEYKQTEFDRFIERMLYIWLTTETANAAIETAATTRADIRDAIAISVADNHSNAQTAKAILRTRGFSKWRADTIARTETHNAAMYAGKESANKLELETDVLLEKGWLSAEDKRTRNSHRFMVAHAFIRLSEKFKVGASLMDRPGDPKGEAKEVIRCRCGLKYKVV